MTLNDALEVRDHMISEHAETEDYLVCPYGGCGMIVYDLLSHWMARHISSPMPAGMLAKAINAPKDYKTKIRKELRKARAGSRFKEGEHYSEKNGYKLHFRSGWEQTVYRILDKSFAVARYEGEKSVIIPYWYKGVQRQYWPDVKVIFIDQSVMLIEVKPLAQCPNENGRVENQTQEQNMAKWEACKKLCDRMNWDFVVWTERTISHLSKLGEHQLTKPELAK